jgi:carbon storage regulator
MLVLSRKKNEQIVINNNIIVTIVDVKGDKVRLGVDAPRDMRVDRREVHEKIKRQNGEKPR